MRKRSQNKWSAKAVTFRVLALSHDFFQAHTVLFRDLCIHSVCHSLNRRIPLYNQKGIRKIRFKICFYWSIMFGYESNSTYDFWLYNEMVHDDDHENALGECPCLFPDSKNPCCLEWNHANVVMNEHYVASIDVSVCKTSSIKE